MLNDGSKVLTYGRSGTVAMPGTTTYEPRITSTYGVVTANGSTGYYDGLSTTYVPHESEPISLTLSCTVSIMVNPSGTIVDWTSRGNDCVSR